MSNIAQIGDIEREFISGWVRDVLDVVQQMRVEPKLGGFCDRIERPARRIGKLIANDEYLGERIEDLDALIPNPTGETPINPKEIA